MTPLIQQLIGDPPDDNPHSASPEERACWEKNDNANAKRLLSKFGTDMVFTNGKGWGIWDGNRFHFDVGSEQGAAIAAKLPEIIKESVSTS